MFERLVLLAELFERLSDNTAAKTEQQDKSHV